MLASRDARLAIYWHARSCLLYPQATYVVWKRTTLKGSLKRLHTYIHQRQCLHVPMSALAGFFILFFRLCSRCVRTSARARCRHPSAEGAGRGGGGWRGGEHTPKKIKIKSRIAAVKHLTYLALLKRTPKYMYCMYLRRSNVGILVVCILIHAYRGRESYAVLRCAALTLS